MNTDFDWVKTDKNEKKIDVYTKNGIVVKIAKSRYGFYGSTDTNSLKIVTDYFGTDYESN